MTVLPVFIWYYWCHSLYLIIGIVSLYYPVLFQGAYRVTDSWFLFSFGIKNVVDLLTHLLYHYYGQLRLYSLLTLHKNATETWNKKWACVCVCVILLQ